jgi:hypothetical protein
MGAKVPARPFAISFAISIERMQEMTVTQIEIPARAAPLLYPLNEKASPKMSARTRNGDHAIKVIIAGDIVFYLFLSD